MISRKNFPSSFVYRTSIYNNFISENGIVTVLGDEDQVIGRGAAANELPPAGEIGARVK